jgi:multisubunit Na+/H+ antiporter MnhC subunit
MTDLVAPDKTRGQLLMRFCTVVAFGIAFAYIESAVVVYLRAIFYPDGFVFPIVEFAAAPDPLWKRLILTEIGREAATLVLILTASWLIGKNARQRLAAFLAIFAVWDIFYYLWLKLLLDWPAAILDWDILFMIPVPWASPVLAPVLVSIVMLAFSWIILDRDRLDKPLTVSAVDWLGFAACALLIILSFCLGGRHIAHENYAAYFSWPLFAIPLAAAIALFTKCTRR